MLDFPPAASGPHAPFPWWFRPSCSYWGTFSEACCPSPLFVWHARIDGSETPPPRSSSGRFNHGRDLGLGLLTGCVFAASLVVAVCGINVSLPPSCLQPFGCLFRMRVAGAVKDAWACPTIHPCRIFYGSRCLGRLLIWVLGFCCVPAPTAGLGRLAFAIGALRVWARNLEHFEFVSLVDSTMHHNREAFGATSEHAPRVAVPPP